MMVIYKIEIYNDKLAGSWSNNNDDVALSPSCTASGIILRGLAGNGNGRGTAAVQHAIVVQEDEVEGES